MPGARHPLFRLGDRTELLVEFCLNTIAFTTPIARQEDVGHDLFCVLSEDREGLIWAGPSFTVQIRSNCKPLIFKKSHEIAWAKELENPFFLAVGHRHELRVEIYSTWPRLRAFEWKAARRIVLQPGPPVKGRDQVWTAKDASNQIIALGKPIITATAQEFMDKSRANALREVLEQWIHLDRINIVNNRAGIHWVMGPETYETNRRLGRNTRHLFQIFWNAKNLQRCRLNFGRAATELRLTIQQILDAGRRANSAFAAEVAAVDSVLRTYWKVLDPSSQAALSEHAGRPFRA